MDTSHLSRLENQLRVLKAEEYYGCPVEIRRESRRHARCRQRHIAKDGKDEVESMDGHVGERMLSCPRYVCGGVQATVVGTEKMSGVMIISWINWSPEFIFLPVYESFIVGISYFIVIIICFNKFDGVLMDAVPDGGGGPHPLNIRRVL
jgi:hypothetical protein